jgi:ubiquinone/menaquinone biosynthesis C-methylase UbiE
MPSDNEVDRLRKLYVSYIGNEAARKHWSDANAGNRAILEERQRVLRQVLEENGFMPLANRRILDIGTGSGKNLERLMQWGALPRNLFGIDLVANPIEWAKRSPEIRFTQGNAEHLDFDNNSFDLILLFTVFLNFLDNSMARNVAEEVKRVLKPRGAVVWYDLRYNNPFNHNVRGVPKVKIQMLFPNFTLRLRTVTVVPQLARRLGRATPILYPMLSSLPFIRSHYAGILVKPAE